MALYALFYLSFFALLERTIQTPDLWVHCQLDDLIPFCKYAIIPYMLLFRKSYRESGIFFGFLSNNACILHRNLLRYLLLAV